ncbi:hypothetical protein GFD21_09990 [Bifidobacterium sp. SMA15]|uniref:DUF559 domain-containing protein n=2 Tax=Bifidobacterium platyrrhinorum TaxID=2661628 RepID=A0A6L9STX9_9BIFI|nr:hypothetical protein [Bifidobacterium platyrrhinorum]
MGESLAQRRRDVAQRCTEAARRFRKRLMFGMTTSLALQSVPIPADCSLDTQVLHTVSSTKAKRIRPRSSSIHAHTWAALIGADNIRVNQWVHALDLFHTWAQLAPYMPLPSLIALGDAVIAAIGDNPGLANDRDPLAIHTDFLRFARTLPRFNGKSKCLRASGFIRPNVDSLQESACRLMLLAHGIPEPVTNHTVPGMRFRSGASMTLDLAWPDFRVALEYDGDHHRTDKTQWRRDQEKRDRLRNDGWIISTATGATLSSTSARDDAAFAVARQLAGRGADFTFHVLERPIERLTAR